MQDFVHQPYGFRGFWGFRVYGLEFRDCGVGFSTGGRRVHRLGVAGSGISANANGILRGR